MSTVLLYAPAVEHHQPRHPESPRRLQGLLPFLREEGVLEQLRQLEPEPASLRQITRVHAVELVEQVRAASQRGGGLLDADTYTTSESYRLALLAAGSSIQGVDEIASGRARNGLALVRPPGHHAGRTRVGGFCLFNNLAIAARQAQAVHDMRRIFIVDFDVHHGNGTQDIFYADENVCFISLHLYHPFFYPGTGGMHETGRGAGRGRTVNVPFPPNVGDVGYRRAFAELVQPLAHRFQPQLILASVGFDAHWQDPLASAGLSLSGYAHIMRSLVAMAEELSEGRILFVLEGGYQPMALRYGVLNLVNALTGRDVTVDPLGALPQREHDVTFLLEELKELHLLN